MRTRPDYQIAIATFIVNREARRDQRGKLAIYRLPKADGGGTFEVAGINDRYHPGKAAQLRDLINKGLPDQAEAIAREYILTYTDAVTKWSDLDCFEAFLRDTAFNRGLGGAAKVLQIALGNVKVDGGIGPKTLASLATQSRDHRAFLAKLRAAREQYEIQIAPPIGARRAFWKGLTARWNAAHAFALTMA